MRIACDVCVTAAASVICCADEAVLCARCDNEVHAANKLAGKHRRLPLHFDAAKFPRCDICQDKSAFIFCVEDRALFCQDCDEAIHTAAALSGNHQRLLATGICVGFSSANKHKLEPKVPAVTQTPLAPIPSSSSWSIDDFLQLSESHGKEASAGFGELSWLADIGFSAEQMNEGSIAAAEVPEMLFGHSSIENLPTSLRSNSSMLFKKPGIQMFDDEDFFTVPDLG